MKKTSKRLFAKFIEALIAVVLVSQFVPQRAVLFAEEAPTGENEVFEENAEEEILTSSDKNETAQIYSVVYDFGNKKVEGIENNEIRREVAEGSEVTLFGSEDVHDNSGKHGLLGWVTESKAVPSSGVLSAEQKIAELVTKDYFHLSGSSYTVNSSVTFYAIWAAKANGTLPPVTPETPVTPVTPVVPEKEEIVPVTPVTPETPEAPVTPSIPAAPETEEEIVPVTPVVPENPETEEEIAPVVPVIPEISETEEEIAPVIPPEEITSVEENVTPASEAEETPSVIVSGPEPHKTAVVSVPEPKVETLSETEIAKILPTETIAENIAPQTTLQGRFALANLMCVAATALLGIATLLAKGESDEDEEDQYRRNRWMKAIAALVFLAGAIFFCLTEDMTLPMVWTDRYTVINAILLVASVITTYFGLKKNRDEECEEANA